MLGLSSQSVSKGRMFWEILKIESVAVTDSTLVPGIV